HQESITIAEYGEYLTGVVERVMCWAGENQERWAALLSPIRDIPAEQFEHLVARLEALPLERFADDSSDSLRGAIRHVLHQKRTIEGIYPIISDDQVARFDAIYERLSSVDPIRRGAWLFDSNPEL